MKAIGISLSVSLPNGKVVSAKTSISLLDAKRAALGPAFLIREAMRSVVGRVVTSLICSKDYLALFHKDD